MIFVSIDSVEKSKTLKRLLTDKLQKESIILDEEKIDDYCKKMKRSTVIISDMNLSNLKFALAEKKQIIVILDCKRKLSKLGKEFLKDKRIYCCKSLEQSVEIASYIVNKNKVIKRFSFLFVVLLFIFVIAFLCKMYIDRIVVDSDKKNKVELVQEAIDYKRENVVFIGDSITYFYDLEKYYKSLPVINSGIGGYRTDDVYNTLREKLYVYNPTKVFLLVGTNDFLDGKNNEYIVNKIEDIVDTIHDNRPNAKIYLESIYPINNTDNKKIDKKMVNNRDNNRIKEINKELKEYCKEEELCTYIDMYNELVDGDGNLRLEYTTEGLHISDKGYEVVTEKLMKYIEKVEK